MAEKMLGSARNAVLSHYLYGPDPRLRPALSIVSKRARAEDDTHAHPHNQQNTDYLIWVPTATFSRTVKGLMHLSQLSLEPLRGNLPFVNQLFRHIPGRS